MKDHISSKFQGMQTFMNVTDCKN